MYIYVQTRIFGGNIQSYRHALSLKKEIATGFNDNNSSRHLGSSKFAKLKCIKTRDNVKWVNNSLVTV